MLARLGWVGLGWLVARTSYHNFKQFAGAYLLGLVWIDQILAIFFTEASPPLPSGYKSRSCCANMMK